MVVTMGASASGVCSFCTQPGDRSLLSSAALIGLAPVGPDCQPGLGTPPMHEFSAQGL